MTRQQLAEELHKPITRRSEKWKVHSSFKDNIWGADLEDIKLICKYNKGFNFLKCAIDIQIKCAWVASLKDRKFITIYWCFPKTLD